ncbi:MAG: fumarylacetoacetate hydrolase family protein [Actinomycetota bacterium]
MRIARYTLNDEMSFGVVEDDAGEPILRQIAGDPLYREVQFTGVQVPVAEVRLLAPVLPRSKVVGVGQNYRSHCEEMGMSVPAEPLLFLKPNTSVIGPGDPIARPPQSSDVHYEGELAVIIGRVCKDIPPQRVSDVIFGYTCANDVTARDLQRSDRQWARAKGFDTFCPLGPWVSPDVAAGNLSLTTRVNDTVVQQAMTSDMVFDVPTLVSYASHAFTLLPGDVILTGTPAGVGPILSGDRVEIEIEGIGVLTNPVRDAGD